MSYNVGPDHNNNTINNNYYCNQEPYNVDQCKVVLENATLWNEFNQLQTEMIITKSGRRMFPSLSVSLSQLDPQTNYCVFLEIQLDVRCRFKYSPSAGWTPAGSEEAQSPNCLYLHPESPARGDHWMSQLVNFRRLKLTNTTVPSQGHIVVTSMHRYQPRIIIVKTSDPTAVSWMPKKCVSFAETRFIAVTAYQNDRITKLKIDHNPFAKGFRENGKSTCKRKLYELQQQQNQKPNDPNNNHNNNNRNIDVSSTSSSLTSSSPPNDHSKAVQSRPPHPYDYYHYYYYHQQPYEFGTGPYWPVPPYHYYYQNEPENLSKKPKIVRKLTDFSIRAITGII